MTEKQKTPEEEMRQERDLAREQARKWLHEAQRTVVERDAALVRVKELERDADTRRAGGRIVAGCDTTIMSRAHLCDAWELAAKKLATAADRINQLEAGIASLTDNLAKCACGDVLGSKEGTCIDCVAALERRLGQAMEMIIQLTGDTVVIRPDHHGHFPFLETPFRGQVALGNGTQWRVQMLRSINQNALAVQVSRYGLATFRRPARPTRVMERLSLPSTPDSRNMSDFINDQMVAWQNAPRMGSYMPELCCDDTATQGEKSHD